MIYKKTKEMLRNALEDVADKGEITSSNLEIIKNLLCSIKYANDIENDEKSNYENNSFDSRPSRNYNYGYDYDQRGGQGGGRSNARRGRDSMGRYSRESEKNEIIAKMHELKNAVSDPDTKHKLEEMIEDLRG